MAGDSLGEIGEGGVDLVAIGVPVTVAGGVEAARGRGAGKGKLLHVRLDRRPTANGFAGRHGGEHGDGHGLVEAQGGSEGVLPDAVATRDHDREERAAQAAREVERSGLEGELDAENGALGEAKDTVPGLDGSAGLAQEGAGGLEGTLGRNEDVPPAQKLVAKEGEVDELVAGDGGEREGQVEEGETVGEPLVQGDNHVALVGVDVFETTGVDAQTEEAGGEPGPPALGHPLGGAVRQHGGEAKHEPRRPEEDKDGYPGSQPFARGADAEIAAEKGAGNLP